MPPSVAELEERPRTPGETQAVVAQVCYLANMTLLPFLGFIGLAVLWLKRAELPPLARFHLRQCLRASLVAGLCAGSIAVWILGFGDWRHPSAWYAVEGYFFAIHSPLTVFGMIGLAKAMAGLQWPFPIVGSSR